MNKNRYSGVLLLSATMMFLLIAQIKSDFSLNLYKSKCSSKADMTVKLPTLNKCASLPQVEGKLLARSTADSSFLIRAYKLFKLEGSKYTFYVYESSSCSTSFNSYYYANYTVSGCSQEKGDSVFCRFLTSNDDNCSVRYKFRKLSK